MHTPLHTLRDNAKVQLLVIAQTAAETDGVDEAAGHGVWN